MNQTRKSRFDMTAAWLGMVSLVLLLLGFAVLAGFMFPVHPPSADAATIATIYRANENNIRTGMILVMFSALFAIPFSMLIVRTIARIEGEMGILSLCALLGGVANMVLTFYPAMWWLTAAFRPERNPDLVLLVNDAAWLQILGGVTIFFAMPLSMAIAAFTDGSDFPAFPRWSAYVNIWLVLLIIPDQLIFYFHRGMFAWNGLFGFYIPLTAFGGWYMCAFVLLRRHILRERQSV